MQFKVSPADTQQVWSDLYAMHYRRSHVQVLGTRETVINRWRRMSSQSAAMNSFSIHFQREWLLPSRFWRWQVYHTAQGVAKSNNPLEQYHGPLKKSLNLSKNTTVFALVEAMETGMALSVRAERFVFVNECEVSHRMYQRYKRLKTLGLLEATREPGDSNPCFRVRQLTFEEASDTFERTGNNQAMTALIKMGEKMKHKHECHDQPRLGWLVHSVRRQCGCDQWYKHSHILDN